MATTEAVASMSWWAMLDSNQRPLPCEGSTLPLSQSPSAQKEYYQSPHARAMTNFRSNDNIFRVNAVIHPTLGVQRSHLRKRSGGDGFRLWWCDAREVRVHGAFPSAAARGSPWRRDGWIVATGSPQKGLLRGILPAPFAHNGTRHSVRFPPFTTFRVLCRLLRAHN